MPLSETDHIESEPARLLRLLESIDGTQGEWREDELRLVWRHQLVSRLDLNMGAGVAGSGDASHSNVITFGELFEQSKPPLEVLVRVKDFAKRHLECAQSPLPAEIAHGLYFATLMTALVHWNRRISQLDDVVVKHGVEWCLRQQWLDNGTRTLLEAGLQRLQESDGSSGCS